MENLEKLAPYVIQYNKLVALFGNDPDLDFDLDNETRTCVIHTQNYHKAKVLEKYLVCTPDPKPSKDSITDVSKSRRGIHALTIKIDCPVGENDRLIDLYTLFGNNEHFVNARIVTEAKTGTEIPYCTFFDETIQYPADNRFVIHGYQTTLAEDIVKDLFTLEARKTVFVTEEKENW